MKKRLLWGACLVALVLARLSQEGYALKSTFKAGENQPVTLVLDKRS